MRVVGREYRLLFDLLITRGKKAAQDLDAQRRQNEVDRREIAECQAGV